MSLRHPELTVTSHCRWRFARISSSYSPGAAFSEFLLSSITRYCLSPWFLCLKFSSCQSWHFNLWFHHLMSQCAIWHLFKISLKNHTRPLLMIKLGFTSQIVLSAKTICSLVSKLFSLELESTNVWHQC